MATGNFFSSIPYHLGNILAPQAQPYPGAFCFQNLIISSLCHREGSQQKWSWLVKCFLRQFVHRHTQTDKRKVRKSAMQSKPHPAELAGLKIGLRGCIFHFSCDIYGNLYMLAYMYFWTLQVYSMCGYYDNFGFEMSFMDLTSAVISL